MESHTSAGRSRGFDRAVRRLRSDLAGWLTGSRAAAKAGERMRGENVDESIGSDQSSAVARRAHSPTPLPSRCPPALARRGRHGAYGWVGSRVIVGQVVGHRGGQPAAQRDCAPGPLGPERAGDPLPIAVTIAAQFAQAQFC